MNRHALLGLPTLISLASIACGSTGDPPVDDRSDSAFDSSVSDTFVHADVALDAVDARDTGLVPPGEDSAVAFDTMGIPDVGVDVGVDTGPMTCTAVGAPACVSASSLGTCSDAGLAAAGAPCGASSPSCFDGVCRPVWAYAVGAPGAAWESLQGLVGVGSDQFVGAGLVDGAVWLVRIDADGNVLGQRRVVLAMASDEYLSFDHVTTTNAPGGLLVAGGMNGPTKSRAFIVKIRASDLTVTNSVVFDVPSGYPEGEGTSTLSPAGSGYLVAGGSAGPTSGTGGMWLARLDEDLAFTLNRTIRVPSSLSGGSEAAGQMIPFGTGYLVAGVSIITDALAPSGHSNAAALLRLGSTLDVDVPSSNFYPMTHVTDYDESFNELVDVGDGVIVIGNSIRSGTSASGPNDLTLMKVRTDGTVAWSQRTAPPNGIGFRSAIRSKDGNLFVVGQRYAATFGSSSAWILEVNGRTGSPIFEETIDLGTGSSYQSIAGVAETSSGDLILGGAFEIGAAPDYDFIRIPASGFPSMGAPVVSPTTPVTLTPQAYVGGTSTTSVTVAPLAFTLADTTLPRTTIYPR